MIGNDMLNWASVAYHNELALAEHLFSQLPEVSIPASYEFGSRHDSAFLEVAA